MSKWLFAATAASMLAGLPALAQQSPRGGGMGMMRMADTNGDGVVSRDEYTAAVDARFDRLDVNHDGVLDASEMPMRGRMMGGAETPPPPAANGSAATATGTPPATPTTTPAAGVTKAQYREGAMRRFDRMDANHDGRIDQAEMAAMRERMRGNREGAPAAPAAPGNQ